MFEEQGVVALLFVFYIVTMLFKIKYNTELTDDEINQFLNLWNKEYPINLIHKNIFSFQNYLNGLSEVKHFIINNKSENLIIGWAYLFNRENEKWFAIIIDSNYKKQGFGKILINVLQNEVSCLNGWVVNHNNYFKQDNEVYQSPLNFYLKLGFKVMENDKLELPNLAAIKIVWEK